MSYCIDLLLKDDQTDHSYVKGTNFTSFVNRGKLLKIVSLAVSNIIQELEKSFQAVVVINKKLHNNVKQNIVMLAKTNILNKSIFFFPNSHPINVDIGSPSHEYSLFTALSQSFVNIRMRHYAKEINSKQVFKNKSSLRQKLTKLILFNNV